MASSPKIDELRKKFEENPRRYFAPLANEYRKAGDTEQAIAICREYLPQQPGHMSGHIVFGQALFEAKQLDEAKTVFETALSLDPENLIALKHLGDITSASGDKEAAMGWYRRVLDADPRNEETQALLAKLEGPKAAPAATPATAQEATPVSKTMPMPAAKAGTASSAPTVVMQAMRPLPKLGATGLPMPAVPKPTPTTATTATTGTPATTATTSKPTPVQSLSTQPTVPFELPKTPAPPAPAAPPPAAIAPTQEIRMDGLTHGADSASKVAAGSSAVAATVIMEAAPGMKPVSPADVPVVAPAMGLETTAVSQGDAPPIDSFSLDGLETTSMAPPPAPAAPPPPVAMEMTPAMDLDLSVPPPIPAAAPPASAPEIELELPAASVPPPVPAAEPMPAIDLEFAAPTPPSAPPALVAPAPVADEPGLVDLDVGFAPPPTAQASPAPAAVAPIPAPVAPSPELLDVALDLPAAAPVVAAPVAAAVTPAAPPAAPAPPPADVEIETPAPAPQSGPFVTETMAELYLQQGHREEALRVYRALLEQRPGDAAISAKVEELTRTPVALPPAPALPPLPPAQGPTIRAVLMLIAMRRPGYRPEPANGNGAPHGETHESPRADSATVEHSPDALSSLWNHAAPQADEENAALVLSAAFADLDGATHGNGAMDLSGAAAAAAAAQAATAAALAAGAPAAPSSFSFDKFFSQRATAEHAAQSGQAGAPNARAESREDVAHFTQWLEGLKQR